MLSPSAFNALLKTLEEPPAHVIFILATTEVHKLLPTILSRCQRFDFKRIAPEDIVTENLSVSPMYDYQYGKLGESQTVIGYQVENRLRVTVRDVNQVGAVMDAGVAAGANEAFGITFLSSNEADAADQALRAAVAEGQRKAELMAEACGKTLGNLVSVNENAYGGSGGVTLKYAADAAAGTTVLANDLTVSAQVTLTYQLAE